MLGESQLNVYILGSDLTAQQRQRIQAQVQTALRSLPAWAFGLLRARIEELGVRNLPLIVEPRAGDDAAGQAFSLGHIESRPAARLLPRLQGSDIQWGQDIRYLAAKAVGYLAAPETPNAHFWSRWADAVAADRLAGKALEAGEHWQDATNVGLLVEMFAACALNPEHSRWSDLPAARAADRLAMSDLTIVHSSDLHIDGRTSSRSIRCAR